jgi:excisionase family DNA binding protein
MEQLTYSVSEAAEAANISHSFLYKCVANGVGPRFRKAGTRTLILKSDLEEWLRSLPEAPNHRAAHPNENV